MKHLTLPVKMYKSVSIWINFEQRWSSRVTVSIYVTLVCMEVVGAVVLRFVVVLCRLDKRLCMPLKSRKYTCQFIDAREFKNGWWNGKLMGRLNICHVAVKISYSNYPNTFTYLVFPDSVEKHCKAFARWKITKEMNLIHTNYGEGFCW